MNTYRVTLKITTANGEPMVIEVHGDRHQFIANKDSLNVFAEDGKTVAVFPGGEFVAVQITEDEVK